MVYIFNIGGPGGNKLNLSSILRPNTAFGPVRVIRFNLDGQVLVTGHDVGALEVFSFHFSTFIFSISAIQQRKLSSQTRDSTYQGTGILG